MPTLHTILRRVLYTAGTISTLLLLATLILWPLSHFRSITVSYDDDEVDSHLTFEIASGRAKVLDDRSSYAPEGTPSPPGWHLRAGGLDVEHWSYLTWNTEDPDSAFEPAPTFLGICWHYDPPTPISTFNFAFIPFSYLTLLFSILPLLALRSLRRHRKAARFGLCPTCSYDLRAHATGQSGPACPECGSPIRHALQP